MAPCRIVGGIVCAHVRPVCVGRKPGTLSRLGDEGGADPGSLNAFDRQPARFQVGKETVFADEMTCADDADCDRGVGAVQPATTRGTAATAAIARRDSTLKTMTSCCHGAHPSPTGLGAPRVAC